MNWTKMCLIGARGNTEMAHRRHGPATWSRHPFEDLQTVARPPATRIDLPVPVFRTLADRVALVVRVRNIAMRYAIRHWPGLVVFLDDGRVEMDTNVVERAIRPNTLTRKNALFAGSNGGAKHWALAMTLIQTAKLNGASIQWPGSQTCSSGSSLAGPRLTRCTRCCRGPGPMPPPAPKPNNSRRNRLSQST